MARTAPVKPFWSPDSRTIEFGRAGRLWRVDAARGAPVVICDLPGSNWDQDAGGAWLPDDTIVFTTGGSPLMRVPAAGGDPVQHLAADAAGELHFHFAHALPGARGLLYVVHRESGPDTSRCSRAASARSCCTRPARSFATPSTRDRAHPLLRTPVNEGVWAPFRSSGSTRPARRTSSRRASGRRASRRLARSSTCQPRAPSHAPPVARRGTGLGSRPSARQRSSMSFPELSPDGTQVAIGERVSGTWGLSVIDLARGTRAPRRRRARIDTGLGAGWPKHPLQHDASRNRRPGHPPRVARRLALRDPRTGLRPVARRVAVLLRSLPNNDFDLLVGARPHRAGQAFVGGALADVAARPSPDGRLVAASSMRRSSSGNPRSC